MGKVAEQAERWLEKGAQSNSSSTACHCGSYFDEGNKTKKFSADILDSKHRHRVKLQILII